MNLVKLEMNCIKKKDNIRSGWGKLFVLRADFFLKILIDRADEHKQPLYFIHFFKFQLKTVLSNDIIIEISCLADRIYSAGQNFFMSAL